MKLKKAAIWGIAVVLLAGGIAAGAVVLNGRPETKDNLINMAKIIKPRGDKTHVIVKVSQNIGTEDYTEPYEDDKDYSNDTVSIACWGDSMMEGFGSDDAYILTKAGRVDISYYTAPYTLGKLTGLNTFNFGVSGETSEEIARRAGGLKMHTDRNLNLNKNTYEDVCRLLGWKQNVNAQSMGGYFYDTDTKTLPVFINYDKTEDSL